MTFFKGIKFRLTALFVALYAVLLVGFSAFLYNVFIKDQQNAFDATLFNYSLDITASLKLDNSGKAFLSADFALEKEKVLPFNIGKTFIFLRDPSGLIISQSPNAVGLEAPQEPSGLIKTLREAPGFNTVKLDADRNPSTKPNTYRIVTIPIQNPQLPQLYIQVAAPMDLLLMERKALTTYFALAIPLVLAFSGVVGFFFSKKALQPVDIITQKAQDISSRNLSERLPIPENKDELFELATTLNGLLARLENAFQSQEQFVADASHQLKTPLAIMRGEIDVLRSQKTDPQQMLHFLESASQEVTSMTKIIGNLLLLARASSGGDEFLKSKVRVDEIVLGQASALEPLAKAKDIKIKFNLSDESDSGFEVSGNEELLGCLFQNLLENAIKYSPEKSLIEIILKRQKGKTLVAIRDQGPGIPESERQKIFEPFYRGHSSQFSSDGAGLGLSLARKVAQVHDAELTHQSLAPQAGSQFTVEIKNF